MSQNFELMGLCEICNQYISLSTCSICGRRLCKACFKDRNDTLLIPISPKDLVELWVKTV